MSVARHHRQAGCVKHRLDACGALLVALTLEARRFEVADRRGGRGADRRWQRGREDEARSIAAHGVADRRTCRDIAAKAAECLRERTLEHVDTPHYALLLGHTAAPRAVHADRVHLVGISHGAIAVSEIADALDRRDVAVHRIERLERDQLRPLGCGGPQQLFQMRHVVVAEDLLLRAGLAHALDHGIVIPGVRQDQAVRHQLDQGRDASLIGDVAGREDQSRLFAMEVGELALEVDQRMVGAGDIAGSTGPCAHSGRGLDHRTDHLRVLPHAKVIVGAPHDHVARPLRGMPDRAGKAAGKPLEVRKYPVAPFVPEAGKRARKVRFIVHLNAFPGRKRPIFSLF